MMYRIETRITDIELVKEPQAVRLLQSLTIQGWVLRNMRNLLHNQGELESYYDISTMETVVVGKRSDEFPWQVWPLAEDK